MPVQRKSIRNSPAKPRTPYSKDSKRKKRHPDDNLVFLGYTESGAPRYMIPSTSDQKKRMKKTTLPDGQLIEEEDTTTEIAEDADDVGVEANKSNDSPDDNSLSHDTENLPRAPEDSQLSSLTNNTPLEPIAPVSDLSNLPELTTTPASFGLSPHTLDGNPLGTTSSNQVDDASVSHPRHQEQEVYAKALINEDSNMRFNAPSFFVPQANISERTSSPNNPSQGEMLAAEFRGAPTFSNLQRTVIDQPCAEVGMHPELVVTSAERIPEQVQPQAVEKTPVPFLSGLEAYFLQMGDKPFTASTAAISSKSSQRTHTCLFDQISGHAEVDENGCFQGRNHPSAMEDIDSNDTSDYSSSCYRPLPPRSYVSYEEDPYFLKIVDFGKMKNIHQHTGYEMAPSDAATSEKARVPLYVAPSIFNIQEPAIQFGFPELEFQTPVRSVNSSLPYHVPGYPSLSTQSVLSQGNWWEGVGHRTTRWWREHRSNSIVHTDQVPPMSGLGAVRFRWDSGPLRDGETIGDPASHRPRVPSQNASRKPTERKRSTPRRSRRRATRTCSVATFDYVRQRASQIGSGLTAIIGSLRII